MKEYKAEPVETNNPELTENLLDFVKMTISYPEFFEKSPSEQIDIAKKYLRLSNKGNKKSKQERADGV